jgi:hypothetical protein
MRRLILLGILLVAGAAHAATPTCDSLQNPVYIQAGDTQTNLLLRLGRALRDNTANPVTVVMVFHGSCTNIQQIYNRTPVTENMAFIPSTIEDPTWTPAKGSLPCTMPTGGLPLDVANSALFVSSCTTDPPAMPTKEVFGPVQAYVLAVPKASSQTAITYEEAYFVFGYGAAGMISPWVGPELTNLFIRTTSKSTLLTWAANISVPGGKWKGMMYDKSSDVVTQLQTTTTPESALGILGDEVYDGLRDSLKVLAFRSKGQYAAYFPDSSFTARDKKNIRDGHYTVWSPTEYLLATDAGGTALSANAQYVVDLIAGKTVSPAPNFDMQAIVAAVGLVPDCAMGVKREFDGGDLSLYAPAQSCVCKYESLVASSSCATCDDSTPCASGTCRSNFCEVQ